MWAVGFLIVSLDVKMEYRGWDIVNRVQKLPFPKLKFILTVIFIIIMERRLWIPEVPPSTMQEDKIIIDLVNLHGHKKWTVIADEMKKIYPFTQITSKQIR